MARRNKLIENVQITDLGDKGYAIGRTPVGEVILVEKAVPGDQVNVLILGKKKGLKKGKVQEFLKYSDQREEPFCQHFEHCGGCKWQNLNYHSQVSFKEKVVKDAIQRIAKEPSEKVDQIRPADEIKRYRNKLEYTFSSRRWLTPDEIASGSTFDDRHGLGFHIAGAFDKVLDIENCWLQEDLSNQIRNALRKFAMNSKLSFYDIKNNNGFLRNLIVRNTNSNQWMIIVVFGEKLPAEIEETLQFLSTNFPKITSLNYVVNHKKNSSISDLDVINWSGNKHITDQIGSIKYLIGPKSFFQTNSIQAKTLFDVVSDLGAFQRDEIVYDLYCGTGSISLYVANRCNRVIGIEIIPEAIVDAKENARLNNISNVEFVTGDVKDILSEDFRKLHGKPTSVITDPPRAGMHKTVVEYLLELECPKLVYVSCNPSTQARDILLLKEKYRLEKVVPVDMFPHTSHVEAVALLTLVQNNS